jgi:large subunit ribosomal protein L24
MPATGQVKNASVHVKRGDTVKVALGKDRGSVGKVLRVYPRKGEVLVEGVNVVKKAIKPSQTNPRGGFDSREAPLAASKVKLVCPNCEKTTRIGHRLQDGRKVRYCKKCDTVIEDNLG